MLQFSYARGAGTKEAGLWLAAGKEILQLGFCTDMRLLGTFHENLTQALVWWARFLERRTPRASGLWAPSEWTSFLLFSKAPFTNVLTLFLGTLSILCGQPAVALLRSWYAFIYLLSQLPHKVTVIIFVIPPFTNLHRIWMMMGCSSVFLLSLLFLGSILQRCKVCQEPKHVLQKQSL